MNYRFNSTFKIKDRKPRTLRYKSLVRKQINKVGKKTRLWDKVRARIKKRYEMLGITTCELGYEGCKRDDWLSFAHGRKRRKLLGDELETLTILACTPCHDRIERMPHEAMLAIVESVISERGL